MPCWISIRPTQCSLTGNTWKDFGAFWLVYLKKCWKFNTGSGDTKTISVLVMFPTSTFLKRRELRQIRRICGKWKSDKCDTSWEHLDLSKKRPFAATRQWQIFIHMSLQNVHKGLFYPHSEAGNNWSIVWSKQSIPLLWSSLRIYSSYISIQRSDCFGDWLSKMNHSAVLLPREISTFW